MHSDSLLNLLRYSTSALKLNLEGVSHEDSLVQPPAGNCINWLVGHILVHRNVMLRVTGEEPIWTEEGERRYTRGSAPIRGQEPGVVRIEKLKEDLERTREMLQPAIARLTPISLAEPTGSKTVGEALLFLAFHESYHVGQLGLARRLSGKKGAIA